MSTKTIAKAVTRQIPGVVVSAGRMQKTVKVRIGVQQWNAHIRKNFNKSESLLVHDPRSSLRQGDVISISPGWRTSKLVHHVVSKIIAPFGEPIEARPAVPTEAERVAERKQKKWLKEVRKAKMPRGVPKIESAVKTYKIDAKPRNEVLRRALEPMEAAGDVNGVVP